MKLDWIKNKAKDKLENHKFQKDYNYNKNILKEQVAYDAQVIFNPTVLSWLFVLVTLFLQIISLATTYAGSKVYFGGIELPYNISAPILFAFSIQVTVFSLSNSLKKNFKSWVVISLLFATFCSTYFSYIGIYNYVNSPIQYLEERYSQVYDNMTNQYNIIVDNAKTTMQEYVFDITNNIQKEYITLSKKSEEYSALNEKVKNVSIDGTTVSANTGSIVRPNINSYGDDLDQYYKDMASYNAAISSSIGQAAEVNSSTQSTLYENEIRTILGGKSLDQFTSEQVSIESSKESLESLVDSMYNLIPDNSATSFQDKISSIQFYCNNFITTSEGYISTFETILTNMYTSYSQLTGSKSMSTFKEELNNFSSISSEDTVFMSSLDDIKRAVYAENHKTSAPDKITLELSDSMLLYSKLQSEIKKGAYTINTLRKAPNSIDITSEEYILHNMYVLPIKNLFSPNENLAMSWFCLGFAALIDGLTLLFALMHRKDKSVLFSKRNSDLVNKDAEFTEELLLSSLVLHPLADDSKNSIENSLAHLAKFLLSFNVTSSAMEQGFSLYAPLDKLDEHNIFLSVLCQFNFAKIISEEDFNLLENSPSLSEVKELIKKGASVELPLKKDDMKDFNTDIVYDRQFVLLKSKFVIWANRKFSTVLSNKELSQVLSNILKEISDETTTYTDIDMPIYDSKEVV